MMTETVIDKPAIAVHSIIDEGTRQAEPTRYFRDSAGYYIGAFGGIEPPEGAIAVPSPPEHASQVWNFEMGAWGQIPDDVLDAAMPAISDRQFFQGLAEEQIIGWEEAEAACGSGIIPTELLGYLEEIPDEVERKRARLKVIAATVYLITDPLVPLIAARKGWTPQRTRDFWAFCASLN